MKYLLFFLLFSPLWLSAQLSEVAEAVLILPEDVYDDIEVIPADDESVLLINIQEKFYKRDQTIFVYKYDANLLNVWMAEVPIERNFSPLSYLLKDGALYYLLFEKEGKKLKLISFSLLDGTWTTQAFETLTLYGITSFDIFNGNLILTGDHNLKPVVEMHNLSNGAVKVLPDVYFKNNDLKGVYTNIYRNEIYVFTQRSNKCQFQITSYNANGKLISRTDLGDKNHKIANAEIRIGNNGEPLLFGAYSSSCNDSVLGFFSGSLDRPSKINYKAISNLKSYDALLNPKRRERRAQKRKEGKLNDIRQKALFSVPFSGFENFIVLAELYNSQTTSGNSIAQRTLMSSRVAGDVYKEYKVYRILLAEVGPDGKVVYDNMIKLEGNPFYDLEPQSATIFANNNFYVFLVYKDDILYTNMSSETDAPVERYKTFENTNLKIRDTHFKLLNWTSKSILAHGVVNFLVGSENLNKEMYFIKKLKLQ